MRLHRPPAAQVAAAAQAQAAAEAQVHAAAATQAQAAAAAHAQAVMQVVQEGPPPAAAAEKCSICLDECNPSLLHRCREEGGWGYTPCRHVFHHSCLLRWVTQNEEVETTRGKCKLPTNCPICRAAVPKSRARVLGALGR